MSKIKFSKQQTESIVIAIQNYFVDKLDQEIGQFDAEFLLDFFSENIGSYYYNQGLTDAKAVLDNQLENIHDALYEIEKPTAFD